MTPDNTHQASKILRRALERAMALHGPASIASKAGMSERTLYRLVQGETSRPGTLAKVAAVLRALEAGGKQPEPGLTVKGMYFENVDLYVRPAGPDRVRLIHAGRGRTVSVRRLLKLVTA